MKFVFVYAHPDDETVGAGGAMRRLVDEGYTVRAVVVTPGQAGEVAEEKQHRLEELGSVKALRKEELGEAMEIIGIDDWVVWGFEDGLITNTQVWSELTRDLVSELDSYEPDFIVTFDHTGWYYHLDHVGVSIAVTRAIDRSKWVPEGLLHNWFHPPGIQERWPYHYAGFEDITHVVDIKQVLEAKVNALKAHASQNISLIEAYEKGQITEEHFQLVRGGDEAMRLLDTTGVFVRRTG